MSTPIFTADLDEKMKLFADLTDRLRKRSFRNVTAEQQAEESSTAAEIEEESGGLQLLRSP
jgi:hypothetical protein